MGSIGQLKLAPSVSNNKLSVPGSISYMELQESVPTTLCQALSQVTTISSCDITAHDKSPPP